MFPFFLRIKEKKQQKYNAYGTQQCVAVTERKSRIITIIIIMQKQKINKTLCVLLRWIMNI